MERRKKGQCVIGYLRVSTIDQDVSKNEAAILKFANDKDFGRVDFINEKVSGMKSWKNRKLYDVVQSLNEGDVLLVPELSRLGRSLKDILDVLNELSDRQVKVYSVKENFQLNGDDIQSKVMRTMFALFAEIEHDLIVSRTKEGLVAARAKGKMLGRPKGPGKSKLDPFGAEIIALLKNGSTKSFIAKRYKSSIPTLTNWLIKKGFNEVVPEP